MAGTNRPFFIAVRLLSRLQFKLLWDNHRRCFRRCRPWSAVLNILFGAFILLSLLVAAVRALLDGDASPVAVLAPALFEAAKTGFEIAIGLVGLMSLWLGLLAVAEAAGLTSALARGLSPLFRRLFPDVPSGHPALGAMTMNIAANMLGLDNAATPMGLKAMQELQTLNPRPDTASRAQTLFMVINTASVTLFPVMVVAYRAQMGSRSPSDVFIPLLLASAVGTVVGIVSVLLMQRQRIFDPVLMAWGGGFMLLLALLGGSLLQLPAADMQRISTVLGDSLLMGFIAIVFICASLRRIDLFDVFVEGAREGFTIAVKLIPYLVAMLAAIAMLRSSGIMGLILEGARWLVASLGFDTRWVDGLPVGLMKTFSGSGARAMMLDTLKTAGPDSFAGHLVSILQGSSETTFYVLAVYFGSVGIRHARTAVSCALIADAAGFIASVLVCYAFFG